MVVSRLFDVLTNTSISEPSIQSAALGLGMRLYYDCRNKSPKIELETDVGRGKSLSKSIPLLPHLNIKPDIKSPCKFPG